MVNRKWILLLAVLVISGSALTAEARGRHPDDEDTDQFPDYNRLEMHPKPRDPQVPPPAAPPEQQAPPAKSSVNAPANLPAEDDTVPKPAPAAVPLPSGASEPPLPDDMMGTLVPSTATQK